MTVGTLAALVATDGDFNLYLGEAAPTAFVPSANHGLVNIGPGPWDGASAGKFVGRTGNGVGLAANFAAGYNGDMFSFQIAGVNRGTFTGGTLYLGSVSGGVQGVIVFGDWNDANASNIVDISGSPLQRQARFSHKWKNLQAGSVPFTFEQINGATEDVVHFQLSTGNLIFGIGSNGNNGQPHRLIVRRTSDSRSMAQTHTLGAYSGLAIEVLDDTNTSLGFMPLYA